ncbi:N,N-dimethylglycine oxidase [Aspergillus steynii IBT 23096]|uniref:N,N-dimethylglycine oxidase n=1 Tax=Aspergillus steynii IBT 23096 TaxID=1392250 RepID=A0A2I2GED6_9EURO|nr:N,N-dimethylglycine oxidase [Aspergillus steynii IBT 23096]PLB51201.1 N,N-dimethylglycine oxidase [Aspergillus steynii IBT 23096]
MAAPQPTYDIAIVGAGIVGSALAYFLSVSEDGKKVALLDRSFESLKGSTGYAPGFVGQYNESRVLTQLAVDTVKEYTKIPGGIDILGGLEIATSHEGVERLKGRCAKAQEAGLAAKMISSEEAISLAPNLVKGGNEAALHFPCDGSANAIGITAFYKKQAQANGVQILQTDVSQISQANGCVRGVMTSSGFIDAKAVVVATGIWASGLCELDIPVPIIPVAHPYMYSESHEPNPHKAPWVRWPEYHVYARDHGTFYGLGSYNHQPISQEPKDSAHGDWIEHFDSTLNRALQFLPGQTGFVPAKKFNGIFSMTPDNMPLVGSIPSVAGLYMAAAVWVTHAAGSAKFLTRLLNGENVDENTKKALDPTRFRGQDLAQLKQESLDGYNSIYKTQENGRQ